MGEPWHTSCPANGDHARRGELRRRCRFDDQQVAAVVERDRGCRDERSGLEIGFHALQSAVQSYMLANRQL
jgi:hypothetical protein